MFREGIAVLTTEQRSALGACGIDKHLISKWQHGHRLPTEPQVVLLAAIVGLNRHQLQDEIAMLRASEAQRPMVERALRTGKRGAMAMLGFTGTVAAALAASGSKAVETATMYRPSQRYHSPH
jgi:ABC-type iron transport system FetAB ATPase subunit